MAEDVKLDEIKVPEGARGIPDPKLKEVVGGTAPKAAGKQLCPHCNQWIPTNEFLAHLKNCSG